MEWTFEVRLSMSKAIARLAIGGRAENAISRGGIRTGAREAGQKSADWQTSVPRAADLPMPDLS